MVLADADAFADGLELANYFLNESEEADLRAAQLGAASAKELVKQVYNDFCRLVREQWDSISHLAEKHPYWVNREDNDDDSQAKRRSSLCVLFGDEDFLTSDLSEHKEWRTIKDRINVALEILEVAGCFILRKGAIESYYKASDVYTSEGKPSAAVDEIAHLDNLSRDELADSFPEMTRCIEYASHGETINEIESLKAVLLSIAAPAVHSLKSGSSTQELNIMSKTILREKADIFEITVNEGELSVDIKSDILDVTGFPIVLKDGDDVVKVVDAALQ